MSESMNNKDTIYVDIDDEITAIIDKVRSSSGRVVALVLPKRASVFQSIVNMKLLKRSAESAKKHIVLITTESGLMPLAGAVGLHVAASPQSKPEIPSTVSAAPEPEAITDELESADAEKAYTTTNAGNRSIGELAGVVDADNSEGETLHVPDEPEESHVPKKQKTAKDKHLKVPSFNKFRLRLLLGVILLLAVIVGMYLATTVLPKATIAISTKASGQNVSMSLTLSPAAQTLDADKLVTPAKIEQQQKTTSQQIATTGQQNNGTAATGSISMSAGSCSGTTPPMVAAGTGVSTSGLTFITQGDANFIPVVSHGQCTWQSSGQTTIAAQTAGAKYNVSSATFSVAGRSEITASGSTNGGTDNIIRTVAQADIDAAKQKLGSQDASTIQSSLAQALRGDGMYPLTATFNTAAPVITTSNNVGDQADNITVTEAVTYTMYGARQADLDTLLKDSIAKQINMQDQAILADGLDHAVIGVISSTNGNEDISLQTTATVGPNIDSADIKKQSLGKKVGDVKSLVNAIPGVTNVDVKLSPFWVGAVPTKVSKVTVTISGVK